MKYFTIGEVARIFGISMDALRYYEKAGILDPVRCENGYRKYALEDFWRINVVKELRLIGFSTENIRRYLENRNLNTTYDLLVRESEMLEEKIGALNAIKTSLEERAETIQRIRNKTPGDMEVKFYPLRRCYEIAQEFRSDDEMDLVIQYLMQKNAANLYIIGNNKIGSKLTQESLAQGHYRNYSAAFILDEQGDSSIPEGDYLSLIYFGDCEQNRIYIPMLFQKARELQKTLEGDVLEIMHSDIHQTTEQSEYINELQVKLI